MTNKRKIQRVKRMQAGKRYRNIDPECIYYDQYSSRFFKSNKELVQRALREAERIINAKLEKNKAMSAREVQNTFYRLIGIPEIPLTLASRQ